MAEYAVIGIARSGVAAANALAERGHHVLASDPGDEGRLAQQLAALDPRVDVELGRNVVQDHATVVVSPGLPPRVPLFAECRKRGLEVIGEIALFQRLAGGAAVLAITGTDGKSTTTAWLGEMCRLSGRPTWVGGNIGIPLCAGLSELTADHVVIAEVSCFQLWTSAEFHPQIAVFTNIAEDHLDYFDGDFEAYQAAKRSLMQNQRTGDVTVLNAGDPILSGWSPPDGVERVLYQRASGMLTVAGTDLLDSAELSLPGAHNVENALAAAGAALSFGVEVEPIREALRTFGGLEHRIEAVGVHAGIRWYNDSKATNPHAGQAALRAFDQPITLLCGGSEKGSDFSDWARLAAGRVGHAICYGQTGPTIKRALESSVPVTRVETLSDAVAAALNVTPEDGIVVLSPVCASYDQFRSYEHRGREFKALVNAI